MGLDLLFSLIILIMSIVIHEVAHGSVAGLFGDPTARLQGRLTLNPIKHMDLFGSVIIPLMTFTMGGFIFGWAKPVEINPYNMRHRRLGELFTAFAGPASNLILALIFGLIIRASLGEAFLTSGFGQIAIMITYVNIALAVFNLIPIPPLDGSKVLFSLLPPRLSYIQQNLEQYSMVLVLFFIVFLWHLVDPIIPYVFSVITGLH